MSNELHLPAWIGAVDVRWATRLRAVRHRAPGTAIANRAARTRGGSRAGGAQRSASWTAGDRAVVGNWSVMVGGDSRGDRVVIGR